MIPIECRPLRRFKWVFTRSLLVQIILMLPWYNWSNESIVQIKIEINSIRSIEYAPAKTGFWLRYKYRIYNIKIPVEIFVRTVAED